MNIAGSPLAHNQELQQTFLNLICHGTAQLPQQKTPLSAPRNIRRSHPSSPDQDYGIEAFEKEKYLSPREMHKWRKSLFSIFVGRLPRDIALIELIELFKDFAPICDVHVCPPESTSRDFTYGFVRFKTLEEARRAVSVMNGRILGNNHIIVEIASETRNALSPGDKDKEVLHDGRDRLMRRNYPSLLENRRSEDREEEILQKKVANSLAELKSESSLLEQIEEILKKVSLKPGETTVVPSKDEGPPCSIQSFHPKQLSSSRQLDSPEPRYDVTCVSRNGGNSEAIPNEQKDKKNTGSTGTDYLTSQRPPHYVSVPLPSHGQTGNDTTECQPTGHLSPPKADNMISQTARTSPGQTDNVIPEYQPTGHFSPPRPDNMISQTARTSPGQTDNVIPEYQPTGHFSPPRPDNMISQTARTSPGQTDNVIPEYQPTGHFSPPRPDNMISQTARTSPGQTDNVIPEYQPTGHFSPPRPDNMISQTARTSPGQTDNVIPEYQPTGQFSPPRPDNMISQTARTSPGQTDNVIPEYQPTGQFSPPRPDNMISQTARTSPGQTDNVIPEYQPTGHFSPPRPDNMISQTARTSPGQTDNVIPEYQPTGQFSPPRPDNMISQTARTSPGQTDNVIPEYQPTGHFSPPRPDNMISQTARTSPGQTGKLEMELQNLEMMLRSIQQENNTLQRNTTNQSKKTPGLYPDHERVKLEQAIHLKEVEFQREREMIASRNAEQELLYEREKLSAGFDSNLQKELDLELQIEVMKNEVKLAKMNNELLQLYNHLNDLQ